MNNKEPTSVKDILIEMKTLSEICVDLAYASLLYSDTLVAEQVLVIEEKVDLLYRKLLKHLSLSIKSKSLAEQLNIYYIIGEANNIISDSAADMASLVLMGYQIKDEIKKVQQHMDQIVDLVRLEKSSCLCGKSEVELDVHDLIGVDIVGIIRDKKDLLIDYNEVLQADDLLIFRGPLENVNQFIGLAKGEIKSVEAARTSIIEQKELEPIEPLNYHQDLLVTMKESAELAVDLAYLFALEDLPRVKSLILSTEEKVDKLQYQIIEEVLRLYKADLMAEKTLIAYLRMADSFEEIADAAIKIAFGVPVRHRPFELLEEVVDDSSESVDYIPITKDSPYVGKTVKEAEQTDDFFQILAVRKRGKYFFFPEDKVKINVGDGLIIKEYSSPEDE
ncbi:MAG: potassium channel family protein [Candidatus Heimdallarchaeaceae archaeon]